MFHSYNYVLLLFLKSVYRPVKMAEFGIETVRLCLLWHYGCEAHCTLAPRPVLRFSLWEMSSLTKLFRDRGSPCCCNRFCTLSNVSGFLPASSLNDFPTSLLPPPPHIRKVYVECVVLIPLPSPMTGFVCNSYLRTPQT